MRQTHQRTQPTHQATRTNNGHNSSRNQIEIDSEANFDENEYYTEEEDQSDDRNYSDNRLDEDEVDQSNY